MFSLHLASILMHINISKIWFYDVDLFYRFLTEFWCVSFLLFQDVPWWFWWHLLVYSNIFWCSSISCVLAPWCAHALLYPVPPHALRFDCTLIPRRCRVRCLSNITNILVYLELFLCYSGFQRFNGCWFKICLWFFFNSTISDVTETTFDDLFVEM